MSLGVFFHEDVADRLSALASANARAFRLAQRYGMDPEAAALARDCYGAALADVALAFGIAPQAVTGRDPPADLTAMETQIKVLDGEPAER